MSFASAVPHAAGQAPILNIDMRKPGLIGAVGLVVLVGVLGLWALTTVIGGAVIASGQAMVQGSSKQVQSLDGGIIAQIAVENGDIVQQGDLLVQLDPTLLQINLEIAENRLAAALAQQARLRAEQLGARSLEFTYPALPFAHPDTTPHEAGQREIFAARAAVIDGGREQLAEAFLQFENQRRGIEGQISATQSQIDLLGEDLGNLRDLVGQGLARQSQLSELQRAEADLIGRMATLEADLARLTNARRNSELATLQTERGFMEGVVTELREVTTLIEELTLEIATQTAQLERIDIRAPVTGIVHEMQVTTLGGVVSPGETLLQVVPLGEGMEFELQVDPMSIDQVHPGQAGRVMIASFDPQSTPQLEAHVTTVSPGVITDPATGRSFYRVGLSVTPAELERLGEVILMPGMPVEAFLETGDRSVLAYLLQPLSSNLRRAFRE